MHIFQPPLFFFLHAISITYIHFNFNKPKVGKEIKISLSEVNHLHNELGHVRIVVLVSFTNPFCNR